MGWPVMVAVSALGLAGTDVWSFGDGRGVGPWVGLGDGADVGGRVNPSKDESPSLQ